MFIMASDGTRINGDAIESYILVTACDQYYPRCYSVTMFSGARHLVNSSELKKVFPTLSSDQCDD